MRELATLHGPNRRLALVGLAPGRQPGVPLGESSPTGRRLRDLIGRPVQEVACTANVLPSPSSPLTGSQAYKRGRVLRDLLVHEGVLRTVVLGMDAARLMGLRHGSPKSDIWFQWDVDTLGGHGLYYAIAPHPSGLSRWWNVPENRESALTFFRETVERTLSATSACVVVFHPETRRVLVELHEHGIGLPGGKREPGDASSLACAARELFEETGARLRSARSILVYEAGPHLCEAWLAEDVTLPSKLRENVAWVEVEDLVRSGARFPEYCARLFARLAAGRLGDLRCV